LFEFEVSNGITLCEACHHTTYCKEEKLAPLFESLLQQG